MEVRHMERPTEDYRLPDGRIVKIYADVSRGAGVIDFQLASGRIVMAIFEKVTS